MAKIDIEAMEKVLVEMCLDSKIKYDGIPWFNLIHKIIARNEWKRNHYNLIQWFG